MESLISKTKAGVRKDWTHLNHMVLYNLVIKQVKNLCNFGWSENGKMRGNMSLKHFKYID